jgi:hypothetical protein
LERHEWARFVSVETVALYDRNTRPFKSLVRDCPHCQHEHQAAGVLESTQNEDRERVFVNVEGLLADVLMEMAAGVELLEEYRSMFRWNLYHATMNQYHQHQQQRSSSGYESSGSTGSGHSSTGSDARSSSQERSMSASNIYHVVVDRLVQLCQEYSQKQQQQQQQRRLRSRSKGKRRRMSQLRPSGISTAASSDSSAAHTKSLLDEQTLITNHIATISAQLLTLEQDERRWRDLQFHHIQHFPHVACGHCNGKFCFQCGEDVWHEGMDCMEYMRGRVKVFEEEQQQAKLEQSPVEEVARTGRPVVGGSGAGKSAARTGTDSGYTSLSTTPENPTKFAPRQLPASAFHRSTTAYSNSNGSISSADSSSDIVATTNTPDDIANFQWKLANSKRCPQCCTLINRDDGCNKVDCTMCGYRFCWICRSSWGTDCGFYRCQQEYQGVNAPENGNGKTSGADADSGILGKTTGDGAASPRVAENLAQPELGVPNVMAIQARLSISRHLPV